MLISVHCSGLDTVVLQHCSIAASRQDHQPAALQHCSEELIIILTLEHGAGATIIINSGAHHHMINNKKYI